MKIFSILLLALFSNISIAARLPTDEEYNQIGEQIAKSDSISNVIQLFKSGQLDPFMSQPAWDIQHTPGVSAFTSILIHNRFNFNRPLGSKSENMELLQVLLKLGDNPNLERHTQVGSISGGNLIDEAAAVCSIDVIQTLEKYGADLNTPIYWSSRHYHSHSGEYREYQNDAERNVCATTMLYLLSKTSTYNLNNVTDFLESRCDNCIIFAEGDDGIDSYQSDFKSELENLFSIHFSERPTSEIPDKARGPVLKPEDSYKLINRVKTHKEQVEWWSKLDKDGKDWSCFFSTTDEYYEFLKNRFNYKDEDYHWDSFLIETFIPYCESLKNQ